MRYTSENVKTIGLIVEDIFTDFSKETIHSVAHAVIDRKDIRLVVIAGRQDESSDPNDKQHCYKVVYNSILQIEEMCRFDGLILTFPNMKVEKDGRFEGIPKVFIASDREDETTVNYYDEMGIREAIDYLVKIMGVTKLCMIGGRDDNADAIKRKKIFSECLNEHGIYFGPENYEKSDMSVRSEAAAVRLLDRNPGVQAIFCVNDQTAVGLYNVMAKRGLMPGKDILVFGFDNTHMSGDMIPPLASIGSDSSSLGQKALELLLNKMAGKDVENVTIPTRLYGRESCNYIMYDYDIREMLDVDPKFIYRMFDECFYRYRNEIIDKGAIDLKRLFYEFVSRMFICMKNRYMSDAQFEEIEKLIIIFFKNRAMDFTDANMFIRSIERLQAAMNMVQKSVYVNVKNNRLLSKMRNYAIQAQFVSRNMATRAYNNGRNSIFDFQIETAGTDLSYEGSIECIVDNFDKLGLRNAALYLFDEPVTYEENTSKFPERIYLRSTIRNGELYVLPPERQECMIRDIFSREELSSEGKGYTAFPLFFGNRVFGVLVCGMNREILDKGEYISAQLSRAIYMGHCAWKK